MDWSLNRNRQHTVTGWPSQRHPDIPLSSVPTGPSSSPTKYRLEDIEVVDLTAAEYSATKQTVAGSQNVTSGKLTSEYPLMTGSTAEGLATNVAKEHGSIGTAVDAPSRSEFLPISTLSRPSLPLFVPLQRAASSQSMSSKDFRSSPCAASIEEERNEKRKIGSVTTPGDDRASIDKSRTSSLFELSTGGYKTDQEEPRLKDFDASSQSQTDLARTPEEAMSSHFRTPTKQNHKSEFRSPKDLVEHARQDVRKEIRDGKQGQELSPQMDALGRVHEQTVAERISLPSKHDMRDVSMLRFEDSSNDSLPTTDDDDDDDNDVKEQVKEETDIARELKRMSSPAEEADVRRKATEKLLVGAGQQRSSPVRSTPRELQHQSFIQSPMAKRKRPSELTQSPITKRITQVATKPGGIHKSRSRLDLGKDGASDPSECNDSKQDGKLCSLSDEVRLSDSDEVGKGSNEDGHRSSTGVGKIVTDGNLDTVTDKMAHLDCGERHDITESIIASASSKYRLSIAKSEIAGAGWALFTLDDIPKGGEIFVKPIFAYALDAWSASLACDHCFFVPNRDGSEGELKPCPVCKVAHYCSQECVDEAYKCHHWAECQFVQKLPGYASLPAGWRIGLRVLIQKHHEPKFEPAWKQVLLLASNKEKLGLNSKNMRDAEAAQEVVERCFEEAGQGYDICEFLLRVLLNQGTILLADGKDLGAMVDPLLSMINHDCAPNASAPVCQDGWMILRSTRAIAAGEEIKVSYINERHAVDQRQLYLITNWQFRCSCMRCNTEIQRKAENKK